MNKMIFNNDDGAMIHFADSHADEFLDGKKYTIVPLALKDYDSSLIYYLKDGELKTKSKADDADYQKGIEYAKAEEAKTQYQRDRQYPSIGDQLDMQYWDQVNGTSTWKDAIAKVKADNPKEAE